MVSIGLQYHQIATNPYQLGSLEAYTLDTMPPKRYIPTEAASIIGISPNSLRNWCATFKDYLSPGATPAPGAERILNDRDIGILQKVKELRAAHRGYDHIKNELATLPIDTDLAPYIDIQPATIAPQAPQAAPLTTTPAEVIQALQSIAEGRYNQLEAQMEAMRAEQRDRLSWFIFGIIVGVLIVGVVAAIVLTGAMLR